MSSFELTQRAKNNLKTIAKFSEVRWGQTQRNMYIKQFDDTFHLLAETPAVGEDCRFIKEGYQKFPQGSHIIFYKRVLNTNIEIIRILHKTMDVSSKPMS
jgi:toxin ParE1/3/4